VQVYVSSAAAAAGLRSDCFCCGIRDHFQSSVLGEIIMLKNVKCARCVKCGKEYEATPNLTNCECGGILDIIYDYDYIKANLTKEKLKSRPNTMWRYRELLPVEETTPDTPLRVGWSPLYEEPRLAKQLPKYPSQSD